MMLLWMAYALLTAAAFAALGALVERALAGRWVARRFVWLSTIAATGLVPVAGSWLAAPRVTRINEASDFATAGASGAVAAAVDVDRLAIVVWVGVSALVVAAFVTSQVGLRRRLRRCKQTLIDGHAALVSDDFGPAVVGVLRPEMVLPEWAVAFSDADRTLVIAHEREHIAARDPMVNAVALGFAVLFPWNVALWWQLKRLRLAIEVDCDARVVRRGHDPVRYGELLVSAHASISRRVVPALALAQHRSALGRRIDALMQTPHRSTVRAVASVGFGAALLTALAAAPPPSIRERTVRVPVSTVGTYVFRAPDSVRSERLYESSRSTARAVARRANLNATLPPASVTPSRADADLATLPSPEVAYVPPIRLRAGGGFGGFVRAVPRDTLRH